MFICLAISCLFTHKLYNITVSTKFHDWVSCQVQEKQVECNVPLKSYIKTTPHTLNNTGWFNAKKTWINGHTRRYKATYNNWNKHLFKVSTLTYVRIISIVNGTHHVCEPKPYHINCSISNSKPIIMVCLLPSERISIPNTIWAQTERIPTTAIKTATMITLNPITFNSGNQYRYHFSNLNAYVSKFIIIYNFF